MIRVIISSVFALHGIIHLMGFVKEWQLGPIGKLSGKTIIPFSENTSRVIGVLWLTACVLMLAATIAYYSRKDWFWIIGIAGLIVSQTLIIIYWTDAKWGTVVNLLLLVVVILAAGRVSFNKMVKEEVSNLLSSSSADQSVITEEEVAVLPEIVQNWLRKSHVIGKPMPASVHVKQKGSMRTDANGDWMLFDAEQYFTINPPGFVWNATIHTDKFIDIVGRDKYQNGKGNMLIKAASLITIANSQGNEIDQGTLIRYMAEIAWFPHAAVCDYLDWEQIDSSHARVTMSYNGVTASGIYTFNKEGLPIGFETQRFGDFKGKYSKETWAVATSGFKIFNGIVVANKSEVTWKLKEGDFTWLRLVLTDIEYR
jgi:hypothetical protein